MTDANDPRRRLLNSAGRFLFEPKRREPDDALSADLDPPRLTLRALEKIRIMSRSRERILANLDEMYREAFERAKQTRSDALAANDHGQVAALDAQMASLDFGYRREQLYFEILLDVRDAVERSNDKR